MILNWSPIEGAFATSGSRATSIDTFWRMVPENERTSTRRKLVIALVDHIREHYELTGHLAPPPYPVPCPDCDAPTWDGLHRNGHRACVMAEVPGA